MNLHFFNNIGRRVSYVIFACDWNKIINILIELLKSICNVLIIKL